MGVERTGQSPGQLPVGNDSDALSPQTSQSCDGIELLAGGDSPDGSVLRPTEERGVDRRKRRVLKRPRQRQKRPPDRKCGKIRHPGDLRSNLPGKLQLRLIRTVDEKHDHILRRRERSGGGKQQGENQDGRPIHLTLPS